MKQHFVPRVYLKQFATKIGNGYFVNNFDKQEGRHIKTNINNICAETNLYTLHKNSKRAKDILAVEKIYANFIEPMYLKAYEILTNDSIFTISHHQRAEILIGIFQLYMRNPRHLKNALKHHSEEISKLYKHAIETKQKGLTYLDEDFSFREWNKESILKYCHEKATKIFKEEHLQLTAEICKVHEAIKIEINKIKDHSQYMTSDNPIVSEDAVTNEDNAFLRSQEFFIPLNKKYAVRLYHDNTKKLNFIYRQSISNGSVHFYNQTLYKKSSRFVIGDIDVFKEYNEFEEMFNTTSIDLKINVAEQVLKIVPESERDEAYYILKEFYDKFKRDGHVTKLDEHIMMQNFKQITARNKIRKQK